MPQTKNAIVHAADACICRAKREPYTRKTSVPTMSDINQITCYGGKLELCCFLVVFCSNSETLGNICAVKQVDNNCAD